MSRVVADWYADPSGRFQLRYWDGATWTEHVSTHGQVARSPLPTAAPPQPAIGHVGEEGVDPTATQPVAGWPTLPMPQAQPAPPAQWAASAAPPPVPGTGMTASHLPQVGQMNIVSHNVNHHYAVPYAPARLAPYPGTEKSLGVAYLLWFFFGVLGVHHFYLGKVVRGVLYLLTFAWFTIGWWVDLFTLPRQVDMVNYRRRNGLF